MHKYTYVYIYICVYVHAIYVCLCIYVCKCMYVYICICMGVFVHRTMLIASLRALQGADPKLTPSFTCHSSVTRGLLKW